MKKFAPLSRIILAAALTGLSSCAAVPDAYSDEPPSGNEGTAEIVNEPVPFHTTFSPPKLVDVPSAEDTEKEIQELLRRPIAVLRLTEEECAKKAAAASTYGNLFDLELSLVESPKTKKFGKPNCQEERKRQIKRQILDSAARASRAKSVLQAMQLFYALAAAETKLEVLRQIVSETDTAISESEKQRKLGLDTEDTVKGLRQQRDALFRDGSQLYSGIRTLHAQLALLLDENLADESQLLWPVVDWNVKFGSMDLNSSLRGGIAEDSERALLDFLATGMDATTLETMEDFLPSIQPLLTLASEGPSSPCKFILMLLFPPKPSPRTVETRRAQLLIYRSQKEREIAMRIQQAYFDMQAAQRRIAFDKNALQLGQERLVEIEKQHASKLVPFAAVVQARTAQLKLENDMIDRLADWYISRVKLLHEEGRLPGGK
ncbi:MAG: TolC family protein [Planctomycetota bacterium]